MKHKLLFSVLATLLFSGCILGNKDFRFDGTVAYYSDFVYRNHVENVIADSFEVAAYMDGGKHICYIHAVDVTPESKPRVKYFEYQKKFGDYNPTDGIWVKMGFGSPIQTESHPCCFYECVDKITITALNDWSDALPSGADLSSLFSVEYKSVMPYIERGFTGDKETTVTQEVTDVAQNQIRLLCSDYPIKLKTYSYPTKSNAQIEICFTLDSGREVKFTAVYKTIGE